MSSGERSGRGDLKESLREMREIRQYMLVALGFALRPLQPRELVDALPESVKPAFYARANANPYYESRGSEMRDSFVEELLINGPLNFASVCDQTPYYGSLKLNEFGEQMLERLLEERDSSPTKPDLFEVVINKTQQFTPFPSSQT